MVLVGVDSKQAIQSIRQGTGSEVYRVDLADVVDKFIGETEKNIDAVFSKAEQSDAILFLDEADALFGRRTDVKDAHDRFTNTGTSYLLKKISQHPHSVIFGLGLPSADQDSPLLRHSLFIGLTSSDCDDN